MDYLMTEDAEYDFQNDPALTKQELCEYISDVIRTWPEAEGFKPPTEVIMRTVEAGRMIGITIGYVVEEDRYTQESVIDEHVRRFPRGQRVAFMQMLKEACMGTRLSEEKSVEAISEGMSAATLMDSATPHSLINRPLHPRIPLYTYSVLQTTEQRVFNKANGNWEIQVNPPKTLGHFSILEIANGVACEALIKMFEPVDGNMDAIKHWMEIGAIVREGRDSATSGDEEFVAMLDGDYYILPAMGYSSISMRVSEVEVQGPLN